MRDKQIEEMARDIKVAHDEQRYLTSDKSIKAISEYLYNAGYRKQSEVIEEVFLALDKRSEDEGLVFIKKSDIVNAIKKKKVEIAREIFEDVEKHLKNLGRTGYVGNMSGILAELKKKYKILNSWEELTHTCQVEIPHTIESIADLAFTESEGEG